MKKFYIYIFFLLAAVLFLRFNRQDLLIKDIVGIIGGDHHQYYALVDFFRGEAPFWYADAPFNKRLLVSLVAAALPLERGFALNLVNALMLYLGFAFAFRTLVRMGLDRKIAFLIVALHIFTFPVFYYSVIGFIDASLVGWMMIMIALLMEKKYVAYSIMLGIGVFLKESIVIMLICGVLYLLLEKKYSQIAIMIAAYAIFYLAHAKIMQMLNYGMPVEYRWAIDKETLMGNLSRPRTYLSFLLSAYPALFVFGWSIYLYLRNNIAEQYKHIAIFLVAGIMLTLGLYAYSLFVAYSDGRFIYPAIAFSIFLLGINYKTFKQA